MAKTRIHKLHLEMILRDHTIESLARLSGVSPPTISYVRNGHNTSMKTLDKISKALQVPVTDIMGYTMFDFDAHDAGQKK